MGEVMSDLANKTEAEVLAAAHQIREDMGITDDDHAEWLLMREAQKDASCCGKCGKAIGAGEPVWMAPFVRHGLCGGHGTTVVPCCEPCGTRPRYRRIWYVPSPFECVTCGRDVYHREVPGRYMIRGVIACSELCRKAYHAARTRKPRPVLTLTCPVCGREFTAARENARTCGSVCRQKDYGRRITHVTGGLSGTGDR
jgi:hypothetical protein